MDTFKFFGRKLIRLLPLYYFILFFGWFVGPYLSSGPTWFTYEAIFYQCSTYWWADMLLISNFVPGFRANAEGCMNWSWAICVDF